MTRAKASLAVFILLAVLEGLLLLLHFPVGRDPWMFYVVSLAGAVVWLGIVLLLDRTSAGWLTWIIVASAVLMRLTVIGVDPIASDDIYRYIWDGKVQAHGFDPYEYAPVDEHLRELRSELLPERINFPEMRTVYPPVAQWVFWAAYSIGGESIFAFKVPLLLADLLTIGLLLLLLRRLGQPLHRVALFAIHPLVILQFMVEGHLDALAFPFVLLFLLLWSARQRILASIALGLSVSVKIVSVIFVPLLLRDAWERKSAWMLLAVIVPVLTYVPYMLTGGAPFESLGIYTMNWSFNGSVFRLLFAALENNQTARLLLMAVTAAGLLATAFRERPLIWKMSVSIFLFFALASTVHPWYLTWLVVFLPLYPRWSFIAMTATIALSNYSGVWYAISGEWTQPLWMGPAEYLPVALLLSMEWFGKMPLPAAPLLKIPASER